MLSRRWLSGLLMQQFLGCIYDRCRDLVLWSFRDPAFPRCGDQDDLVVPRVKADVAARYVVVDHEVDSLLLQLLARAREAAISTVRGEADEQLTVGSPLPETAQDVRGWLESHLPRLPVFRPLAICRFRRPIVSDRCGHQNDVRVATCQGFVQHRCGRGSLDHLDSGWR